MSLLLHVPFLPEEAHLLLLSQFLGPQALPFLRLGHLVMLQEAARKIRLPRLKVEERAMVILDVEHLLCRRGLSWLAAFLGCR